MEFIQSIDFTFVALIICILYEILGKSFRTYISATTGKMKPDDIGYSNCLLGIFYLVFIFVMLWNPILWLPALLLIVLGFITGGVTRVHIQEIKKLRETGIKEDNPLITTQKSIAKIYWTVDKLLSVTTLGWMIFLQLQFLEIIA